MTTQTLSEQFSYRAHIIRRAAPLASHDAPPPATRPSLVDTITHDPLLGDHDKIALLTVVADDDLARLQIIANLVRAASDDTIHPQDALEEILKVATSERD